MTEPEDRPLPARPPGGLRPRVPGHRPQEAAGPPPRPQVTTTLAPPARPARPRRPKALRLSATAWFLAAAAGAAGIVAALLDGDALRRTLTAEAAPGLAADALEDGVTAATALVLGSVALTGLLAVVWTAVLLRRRPWARWLLLLTGVLTLIADYVAQSVVSGGSAVDRILVVVQAGLVMAALVALFWPSTGRWLRGSPG